MAYKLQSFPQTAPTDDAEKLPVSHTVLACSKRYLHNKKRRDNIEHQCGVSQILSENQVRTFHNSRVLELRWIMRTCFLRVFEFL